jgi:hypothetical protein
LLGRRGTGHGNLHWSANFDEVQDFENDIRSHFGGTGFMADVLFNQGTRGQPLGDPKAGLSAELDALSAYVSSLDEGHPSPYRNQDGTLTADAIKGREIFSNSAGCIICHSGKDFTDVDRHDVGTIQNHSGQGSGAPLIGVGFETPTLLGVWETAPYLHDGSAATLRELLDNPSHGSAAGLSDDAKGQISEYLRQLEVGGSNQVASQTFVIPAETASRNGGGSVSYFEMFCLMLLVHLLITGTKEKLMLMRSFASFKSYGEH